MTEPLIDPEAWNTFKSMMDPGFLNEMIDVYLSDAPVLIEQMRTGLANGDIELVRRAAHSLKSNSANLGANQLSIATRELEMIAKNNTLEGAGPKLVQVETEYAKLRPALEGLKNE